MNFYQEKIIKDFLIEIHTKNKQKNRKVKEKFVYFYTKKFYKIKNIQF